MSAVTSSLLSTPTRDPMDLGLPPGIEQYRREVRNSMISAATPLNFTLVLILGTFLYFRFVRPFNAAQNAILLNKDQAVVFRTFTPRSLLLYNGVPEATFNPDGKVYLAVKGKVHDVTSGKNFYGPGGPYENFAGRDATRGLACQDFDEEMLTKNLDGPLDDCSDLTEAQLENLQGWVERFDEKYLVVGKLVPYNKMLVQGAYVK